MENPSLQSNSVFDRMFCLGGFEGEKERERELPLCLVSGCMMVPHNRTQVLVVLRSGFLRVPRVGGQVVQPPPSW